MRLYIGEYGCIPGSETQEFCLTTYATVLEHSSRFEDKHWAAVVVDEAQATAVLATEKVEQLTSLSTKSWIILTAEQGDVRDTEWLKRLVPTKNDEYVSCQHTTFPPVGSR